MFLVHAEDDRLLEAIAAFLQIPGDLAGHQLGAFVEHQGAVEVFEVVDAVFDLVAVPVELPLLGAIAFHIPVDMDLDDLVGRQEAVENALFQGVGIDRLSEVMDVGNVTGFLGCGGQADLCGRGEVFQDFPPGRILGRAAPVAFVDHDQVEEAGREFTENLLVFLRPGDRLIEAEVDLVGRVDAALFVDGGGQVLGGPVRPLDGFGVGRELGHRRTEGPEVVDHGLIDQHVAVGQEQDALFAACLPQPPDDLKGGVGLAGSRGHDQQDAVSALGDGLDGGVDGVDLIVAGRLAAAVVKIVLKNDLLGFGRQALPGAIARPQVTRWRKGLQGERGFLGSVALVRSWKTKPSPLEVNTKGMFNVSA